MFPSCISNSFLVCSLSISLFLVCLHSSVICSECSQSVSHLSTHHNVVWHPKKLRNTLLSQTPSRLPAAMQKEHHPMLLWCFISSSIEHVHDSVTFPVVEAVFEEEVGKIETRELPLSGCVWSNHGLRCLPLRLQPHHSKRQIKTTSLAQWMGWCGLMNRWRHRWMNEWTDD